MQIYVVFLWLILCQKQLGSTRDSTGNRTNRKLRTLYNCNDKWGNHCNSEQLRKPIPLPSHGRGHRFDTCIAHHPYLNILFRHSWANSASREFH